MLLFLLHCFVMHTLEAVYSLLTYDILFVPSIESY